MYIQQIYTSFMVLVQLQMAFYALLDQGIELTSAR